MAEATLPRIAQQDGPRVAKARTNDLGPAAYPPKVQVTIKNARTDDARTYLQTELAIDGEAQLLGLVEHVGAILAEREFPWDLLAKLFSAEGQASLDGEDIGPSLVKVLGAVGAAAPDAIVDSTCIFFGIFEFDEDNNRNPEWEDHRKFLRRSLSFTAWVDLVRTFLRQNDYQRLAAPFGEALATGAQIGAARTGPAS